MLNINAIEPLNPQNFGVAVIVICLEIAGTWLQSMHKAES